MFLDVPYSDIIELNENYQRIFDEEKEALGISHLEIITRDFGIPSIPKVIKNNEIYEISLSSDKLKDPKSFRNTCKHELFHIAAGHCENSNIFKYILIHEPTTILYELTGIKLSKLKLSNSK